MKSLRTSFAPALLSSLLALALTSADPPRADACGAFFARPKATERTPSLTFERVLILHDRNTETEHFIREVVFRGGKEPFGFVVPTPTRPEVFKVKETPFDKLEGAFPFAPPPQSRGEGSKGGSVGAPGGAPKVVILDIKSIGSFTAFILKATDAKALGKWLEDNKLGSTPENDAWLAEYVKRDFFYVALRYEPWKDKANYKPDSGAPRSETMRISFSTPVPYYPYREPRHAREEPAEGPGRAVALWLVTAEPMQPVALAKQDGKDAWIQPFLEGWRREDVRGYALRALLGDDEDKLVSGADSYVVQPFEDQKRSRAGIGDVVFLPEKGVPAAQREKVGKLVKSLVSPGGGAR